MQLVRGKGQATGTGEPPAPSPGVLLTEEATNKTTLKRSHPLLEPNATSAGKHSVQRAIAISSCARIAPAGMSRAEDPGTASAQPAALLSIAFALNKQDK